MFCSEPPYKAILSKFSALDFNMLNGRENGSGAISLIVAAFAARRTNSQSKNITQQQQALRCMISLAKWDIIFLRTLFVHQLFDVMQAASTSSATLIAL